ncbi:MAG: DM13 domain-containing protein [Acidimicrobiales bacterium]|nr:DM13 domain-containing protein [Acidimicrobiales bacterium]HRW37481.1 DM13 domain-containing protein [Aquihabitans sp.]
MDAPEPAPAPTRRRGRWIAGGLVVAAAIAAVAIGVFGVHTLFLDDEVSEAGPEFDSGARLDDATDGGPADDDPTATTDDGDEGDEGAPAAEPEAPTVTTVATGTFTGVDHPGEGTVNLLSDGTQTFARFEDDFATDNGPDLYAVAYVAGERIELGRLKGNIGAQNYELPADVDPVAVEQVAVWCKRFDATFTEATLG